MNAHSNWQAFTGALVWQARKSRRERTCAYAGGVCSAATSLNLLCSAQEGCGCLAYNAVTYVSRYLCAYLALRYTLRLLRGKIRTSSYKSTRCWNHTIPKLARGLLDILGYYVKSFIKLDSLDRSVIEDIENTWKEIDEYRLKYVYLCLREDKLVPESQIDLCSSFIIFQ